ncbi:metallopeptidase family protein [Bailinhaonella thermotolerans]|uniref:Metallopeptidase family protein n=1 Tax=Bailinhaonella thermotolerans TaxID=1070861 RepID=A0A3A4AZ21_9ACTN|nr:metallopeptidase family protein [Bailinhaonella thermotolerans]RJL30480.1 metallopeptidase family protein [Bailinhaonella thermotolerans]
MGHTLLFVSSSPNPRPRRRDRHGRGLRGPLTPPHVPIRRTRGQRFDDLVLDAVDRLKQNWGRELAAVEFAVEEVPPPSELVDGTSRETMPLGRLERARDREPNVVVVYRRPIEARAEDRDTLGLLVHDVVVEQVANLLGLGPENVDPGYDERH